MSSKYNKQLNNNSGILTKQDHDDLKNQSRQLEQVRSDLEGMAYERIVLDVITRDAILSAKRKGNNVDKNKSSRALPSRQQSIPQRSSNNPTTPSNSIPTNSKLASRLLNPSSNASVPTGATPLENIDDFIPIPSYRSQPSQSNSSNQPNSNNNPSTNLPNKRNIPSSQHTSITIGSKTSKMRQGSLPP